VVADKGFSHTVHTLAPSASGWLQAAH
jgi:hypothetical protein